LARCGHESTKWQLMGGLVVLAAASAEAGDVKKAIEWQKTALEFCVLDEDDREELETYLKLYEQGKAYRYE